MSTVVIPSVEHTGSRLLANHIFHSFRHLSLSEDNGEDYCKYYDHVDAIKTPRFVQLAKDHPVIVPLRHPVRCAWSWEKRQKSLTEYFKQWDLIINQIDGVTPMYLRVDTDKRNDDLSAINNKFNLSLETIWPYVGERSWPWVSENKPEIIPLEKCILRNEKAVFKYIESNKSFFGAHYEC